MIIRSVIKRIQKRLTGKNLFVQVLFGSRQVGKTTAALQAVEQLKVPYMYATADEPATKDGLWIEQLWQRARLELKSKGRIVLILDEVQKLPDWSENVKALWDEDRRTGTNVRVIVLGSSPLLVQRGLTESLAGRFELIPVTHWSYAEMQEAFGWSVEEYMYFGGYPGAAALREDEDRWRSYIRQSLVETTISRDILLMHRIDKPALLRRMFQLGAEYSGQILSYQKMTGQLQDAGNTTTLAHYLELLQGIGMVGGLQKYAGKIVRKRASIPKLAVYNTSLMSSAYQYSFDEAQHDRQWWGRLAESAVGAHLLNHAFADDSLHIYYWLDRNREVDYILERGSQVAALEVKSGRRRTSLPGAQAFRDAFGVKRSILVGTGGIPFEEFLLTNPVQLL